MLGAAAESRASFCEQSAHTWHAWKRREPEAGFSLPHWMQSMVLARSWSRMGCWPFLGLRINLLGTSAAALAPEMLHLRGWVKPRWRAVFVWLWLLSFRLAKEIPAGCRPTPCQSGDSSGKPARGFSVSTGNNWGVNLPIDWLALLLIHQGRIWLSVKSMDFCFGLKLTSWVKRQRWHMLSPRQKTGGHLQSGIMLSPLRSSVRLKMRRARQIMR